MNSTTPRERAYWHGGLGFLVPSLADETGSLSHTLSDLRDLPRMGDEAASASALVQKARRSFEDYLFSVLDAPIVLPIDHSDPEQTSLLYTLALVGGRLSRLRCETRDEAIGRAADEMILAVFLFQEAIHAGDHEGLLENAGYELQYMADGVGSAYLGYLARRLLARAARRS